MKMNLKDEIVCLSGNAISWTLTASQTKEVFEIVQIIASIIVSLLTVAYIVWKWFKKAKADGKITADEVVDLVNQVKEEIGDDNNAEDRK